MICLHINWQCDYVRVLVCFYFSVIAYFICRILEYAICPFKCFNSVLFQCKIDLYINADRNVHGFIRPVCSQKIITWLSLTQVHSLRWSCRRMTTNFKRWIFYDFTGTEWKWLWSIKISLLLFILYNLSDICEFSFMIKLWYFRFLLVSRETENFMRQRI